jgi:sugar/nucleoside kinase (ribokinase family)
MISDKLKKEIEVLVEALSTADTQKISAVIGVDGFVDEILHIVDTRKDAENYTRLRTLRDYGKKIIKAAGLSTNIEIVPIKVKLGGNGPILSNALSTLGVNVTYIGALGNPDIHPVFSQMAERTKLISVANPAHTEAFEFEDGKIIISKLESFKDISWENIESKVGLENLAALVSNANLFGLENWTMVPYMSDIWKNIIEKVFPLIKTENKKNYVFFDLADPEKRTNADITEALGLIQEFKSHFKVTLGLNKKEALEIAGVLGLPDLIGVSYDDIDLHKLTTKLAEKLDIYCIVIHPVSEAAAFSENQYFHTFGPYSNKPRLTTGAGDNFNAGFCLGQVLGLPVQLSLVLGTAVSGYYVRNAMSPTLSEIVDFLKFWKQQ